jgi:hypothetical protein
MRPQDICESANSASFEIQGFQNTNLGFYVRNSNLENNHT